MIKFNKENVLLLYKYIIESTGGVFGIRDETLLESAIEAPYQTFDGNELFPSKLEKAAKLGYGLISNHPFVDGNKRIGFYIMLTFLEVNGIYIKFSNEEIQEIAYSIAAGSLSYKELLDILTNKRK
ncbi:MAG: type II toxin-antitoxin system death-on-curing family toxin [Acholeplasmataceae bacterium]|jgi:death-on-curing protein|nr:type II toxin-antitoxin system death-on-curing family toxin [Acholeplasmataceae bacterium]